jgi:dihydrofolate reductase
MTITKLKIKCKPTKHFKTIPMFNLTIKMMQSLDGFIAQDQNDDLKWGSSEDKKLYKQVSTEFGSVIVGKNTYLQMPKIAFKNRETFVVVRDVQSFLNENKIEGVNVQSFGSINYAQQENITFVESKPVEIIKLIESKGKSKALLVGGGIINNLFIQAKLVSEIQVTIAPKIFGSGIKIFGGDKLNLDLELQSFEKISNNELLLIYNVLSNKID